MFPTIGLKVYTTVNHMLFGAGVYMGTVVELDGSILHLDNKDCVIWNFADMTYNTWIELRE